MKLSKIIAAVCTLSLFLTPTVSLAKTLELTLGNNDVYINDGTISKQTVEVAPFTMDGRTLVPVRIVSENFGLNVGWDDATKTVTISNDSLAIKLVIGSSIATVNGEQVVLDVPATEKDGRTLVPVRFVSETLGKKVKWIEASEQIIITDEKTLLKAGDIEYNLDHYIGMMALYGSTPQYTTLMLTEIGKIKSEALKNGYVLKDTESAKEACQELIGMKDEVYSMTLLAPTIELIEDYAIASEYINNHIEAVVDEKKVQETYDSSYVCAKHILILTYDINTGEPLSTSHKNTAKMTANTILTKIKQGEDFYSLIEKYNEDPGMESNPQGYIFTKGEMVKEFEDAVFSMKDGEISGIVETPYGYHIIKKEPLPEIDDAIYAQVKEALVYEEGNTIFEQIMQNNTSEQFVKDSEIETLIYGLMSEEEI